MTQIHFLTDWGTWAEGVAFWVCFLWPALILLFWPWYKDEWGWNMVAKTEMIALALLGITLHNELGVRYGTPLLTWIGVTAVTLIPVIIAWRTLIIIGNQRRGTVRDAPEQLHRTDSDPDPDSAAAAGR
jgi:hypothetical protein